MARVTISLARLKEGVGYRPDFSRGRFYLDLGSGEVEYLNDPDADLEKAKGRDLLSIEPIPESEELGWMGEFSGRLMREGRTDEWRQLVSAINSASPVRHFNSVLTTVPGLREAWAEERERKLAVAAERWLESIGVEHELE